MSKMDDILGGSPLAVAVKLIVVSIIVGIILAATGLQPFDVLEGVKRLIGEIYNMGFDAVEKALGWFLAGALIVIPVWLLLRVFKVSSGKK